MSRFAFALVVILAAALHPGVVQAQQVSSGSPSEVDQTFLDFQVEQAVRIKSGPPPVYPSRLRDAHVEGQVLVQFIVDDKGVAQMNTFKVLKSNDNEFTASVRRAVSAMSFVPAEIGGRKVKQLVQQPFSFLASK